MNKNAIKKFAIEARKKLISSVIDKAGMLGITETEIFEPINRGIDFEVYQTVAGTEVTLNKKQIEQRKKLVEQIKEKSFSTVIEEVSYTWFNRICAIRFMEVNDYLPIRTRALSSEKEGKNEPDLVTQALELDLGLSEKQRIYVIESKMDSNKADELYAFLFMRLCDQLYEILPDLFEKTDSYMELLLDISYTDRENIIYHIVNDIDETDFNVNDNGQIEIIGWLYQYYISEKHDEVVNIRNKKAISKNDVPAATQIFTTDWVVKYMVDNSLGKLWNSCNLSNGEINYKYLLKTEEICRSDIQHVHDIKFIDPCMGSGHVLAYAFDVFLGMYRECGYTDRDAVIEILENNLYGIDLDKRAYQLSYFTLMMKARQYNRRIFTRNVKLNMVYIRESNGIDKSFLNLITDANVSDNISKLLKIFYNAREYGSLLNITQECDYKVIDEFINMKEKEHANDLLEYNMIENVFPTLKKLIQQALLLRMKYSVVCTNPPYHNKYSEKLTEFINDYYAIGKADLFAAFILKNLDLCEKDGYVSMMTPHVWMFIKSYENLRKYIIDNKSISTVVHMAKGAFYSEAAVDICAFVLRNNHSTIPGKYVGLEKFKGDMEVQNVKYLEGLSDTACDYIYTRTPNDFNRIDGMPFSYWVEESVYNDFEKGETLKQIAPPRQGMATTNNERFLRLWFEIDLNKIGFGMKNEDMSAESKKKFFPYNKGGEFRRWYGNNYYVVNFGNHGKEVCDYIDVACAPKFNHKNRVINREYYFKECITWSDISADFSGRYCPEGFIFDIKGSSCFPKEHVLYILGLLNSKLTQMFIDILNPTMTTQVGDMARIPVIYGNVDVVEKLVKKCVDISRHYWNMFEISWDFKHHPAFDTNKKLLTDCFNYTNRMISDMREELIESETKINELFSNTYGLSHLDSSVEEELVSINVFSEKLYSQTLLSYFVGCILGRYSLGKSGIVLTTPDLDVSSYNEIIPDKDNIIPITDEDYFEDDIVTRIIECIKVAFGSENLEENLEFLANSLECKGNSSREILRTYFLTDYYKDHCNLFSITGSGKRPIYWMFDAGKENGFKALIYMHRYVPETVGIVRTDYLHKTQKAIEQAKQRAEYSSENASNAADKKRAVQQITKYTKQLAQMKSYDEAMAHIANQRIEINLDDGVKVNYEKFQGVEVAQEGKKALKIDLLAKIK